MNNNFDFYNPNMLDKRNIEKTMSYQLRMLNNLDKITKRHSENVANVSSRICEYLHCKKDFTFYTTMCAYLHDIGKTMVPQEILFKDGQLTDEEYEIIKNHTIYGYNICMKDPKLKLFADGALYHHENLNGTGYPNHLTKNDIPYSAQIIHVADVYDALVTKRHYTTHVNISELLKDLIKDSEPTKEIIAMDQLSISFKDGKINKKPLNALFKVVIDDTEYEIYSTKQYISYLENELSRLKQIYEFDIKRKKQIKQKDIDYYTAGMTMLLSQGETLDNYINVLHDYEDAINNKKVRIEELHNEIKILKKLKA